MQHAAVMQLYEYSSCSGPVDKAAALVFVLYLPDMKPSSEGDQTVARSSLAKFEQFPPQVIAAYVCTDWFWQRVNASVTEVNQKTANINLSVLKVKNFSLRENVLFF